MSQAGRKETVYCTIAKKSTIGQSRRGISRSGARNRLAVLLILPTLIVLVGLAIYPTLYALWTSLRVYLLYNPAASRFVGLSNYTHLFEDGFAVKSLWLTGLWAVLVIVLQMSLGMALALLLDRAMRAAGVLRTLFIIPVFISPIAMGLTWRFMFEPVSGLVNWALQTNGTRRQPLAFESEHSPDFSADRRHLAVDTFRRTHSACRYPKRVDRSRRGRAPG